MDPYLAWGLGLLGMAVLLVIIEIFLPTGGIVAVLSALAALGGIIALFMHDITWGAIGLLGVLIAAPIAFFGGLRIWENSPIGRRMMGVPSEENNTTGPATRDDREALLGEVGVAVSPLRPVGVIKVGGKRLDAQAEISFIEAGEPVVITKVDGLHILVRKHEA